MPMNISLDWDGTYTADPELWNQFVQLAQQRGHKVTIVTGRGPKEVVPRSDLPIVYCDRTAKRNHFHADVWIDDMPQWIVEDEIKK